MGPQNINRSRSRRSAPARGYITPSCNETPQSLLALKKWALGASRSALGARVGQSALGPRENRVVSRTHGAWVEFSLGGRRMALGGSSLVNFGVPLMRLVT